MGAAVVLLTNQDRGLVAASPARATKLHALARANLNLRTEASEAQMVILEGRPLQLISVPVRAPQWVGQLVLGFELTADLVKDMASLSSVKLALLARPRGQAAWQALPVGEAGAALGAPRGAAIRGCRSAPIPLATAGLPRPWRTGGAGPWLSAWPDAS